MNLIKLYRFLHESEPLLRKFKDSFLGQEQCATNLNFVNLSFIFYLGRIQYRIVLYLIVKKLSCHICAIKSNVM